MTGARTAMEVRFANVPTDFANGDKSKIVSKWCQESTQIPARNRIDGSELLNAVQLVAATMPLDVESAAMEKYASNGDDLNVGWASSLSLRPN